MKNILSYGNKQIRYYIKTNAIPLKDLATFLRLIKQRQEIYEIANISGDTSDEESDVEQVVGFEVAIQER
jgi:hypothetical protein